MTNTSTAATISVAIVSKGRPEILSETLKNLAQQTRRPEKIVVVVPSTIDLPAELWNEQVQTVIGPLGASTQRNAAIAVIPPTIDYVAFFDDDMELRADYLDCAVAFLDANPGVVGLSGHMLGNGKVTREEGARRIAGYQPVEDYRGAFSSTGRDHTLHGCNMVVRRGALEYEKFDEVLPLYSYAEDYDLSLRLENYGRVGRFTGCIAVHLETASGRVREDMRGYSLVANNYYFIKQKKTHLLKPLAWVRFWAICVGHNLVWTFIHRARGDRELDYAGRARGMFRAVRDIFTGRCHPGRIREF